MKFFATGQIGLKPPETKVSWNCEISVDKNEVNIFVNKLFSKM
jgi:hypothetical protein